ncbi:hypothetical protein Enr13x_00290 [Stieleria neptunia]|uniref:Uncharacterized protein n=1 Tax=Stieleria neptunia TaxID=2527979 RepID=A0A518HHA2_9BACT|nr:hypothetical protein [Stieleria neptunia]QDV40223.1 hypothetical protein Enr13x_00290 [Stieleria neptunia]
MKPIAIAAIVLLGVFGVATAAPIDVGHSILVSGPVPAPTLDPTQPPVTLVAPIRSATFRNAEGLLKTEPARTEPIKKPPRNHDQEETKPGVIDKLKALDRKKNAWFKRTFLGK